MKLSKRLDKWMWKWRYFVAGLLAALYIVAGINAASEGRYSAIVYFIAAICCGGVFTWKDKEEDKGEK